MAIDKDGQHFVDLVSPAGPAVPVDMDSAATRAEFLNKAKSRMSPDVWNAALTGLTKVERAAETVQHGRPSGPLGTPSTGGPTRQYPGPAAPDDPMYAAVLAQSGVQYPSQRFINDPKVR